MRVLNSIGEAYVRNLALGCSRDIVSSRTSREGFVLQTSDKLVVVGRKVVREGSWRDERLNVQIETIDTGISEWTRLSSTHPSSGAWPESAP
jgi:hypothetical protein